MDYIFGEEKVMGLRNFKGSKSSTHVDPLLDDLDVDNDTESQLNIETRSALSMQTNKVEGARRGIVSSGLWMIML